MVPLQRLQAADNGVKGAFPGARPAIRIVAETIAVEGETNEKTVLFQEPGPVIIKVNSVGLKNIADALPPR
jgi:hypothetical protein